MNKTRNMVFGMAMLIVFCCISMPEAMGKHSPTVAYAQSESSDKVKEVRLMMTKLRSMLDSLNDMDGLRKAGMPEKDVQRMEGAAKKKIQTMINETVEMIHAI